MKVCRLYIRSNDCVDDCNSSIERKLGYLSGWQLSVSVSKFDHGTVLCIEWRESSSAYTVITGFLDAIVDRQAWIRQVDSLSKDNAFGDICRIWFQNKLPGLVRSTKSSFYWIRIA